jgi:hypothetical protein
MDARPVRDLGGSQVRAASQEAGDDNCAIADPVDAGGEQPSGRWSEVWRAVFGMLALGGAGDELAGGGSGLYAALVMVCGAALLWDALTMRRKRVTSARERRRS